MSTAVPPTQSEPRPAAPEGPGSTIAPDAGDGRTARARRTRTAIVDALLSLLDDGDLQPTANRIAERAGISLRLIYHHFGDLDSLFRAVAERQHERIARLWRPVDVSLPLPERIDAFVDQRIAILDLITAVRRAGQVHEASSREIQETYRQAQAAGRAEIAVTFAAELRTLPAAERESLVNGLQGVLGWGFWNDLHIAGLDRDEARATVLTLLRMLLPTPD